MFRLAITLCCLLTANAFAPTALLPPRLRLKAAAEDIDYDAPVEKQKAVGNIVRTGEGHDVLDHEIVVDDDSTKYKGKDGKTVDMDPLHKPSHAIAHSNDQTDFDAPDYKRKAAGNVVRSGEAGELDHEPIVDDECYTGKEGNFKGCVDFDDPVITKQLAADSDLK